jgi:TRAP-type C4-dicarboxylate transport system permease small subunit
MNHHPFFPGLGNIMKYEGVKKTVSFLSKGGHILGSAAIIVTMFLVCADVFARYVLKAPIVGAFEINEFLIAGIIFIGFAYSQAQKAHMNIDLLTNRLSPNIKFFLKIFNLAAVFLFYALIAWRGMVGCWEAFELDDRTPGLIRIPYWPAKAVVPLGAVLLCLQVLMDIAECLGGRGSKK